MTQPDPPQNLVAEEYVLGALMLGNHVAETVRPILQPRDFFRESHARIYRAALAVADAGIPLEPLNLIDELRKRGDLPEIGGGDRIRELAALVPPTTAAPHHALLIADAARFREIIRVGEQIARIGWEPGGDVESKTAQARELAGRLDQNTSTELTIEDWHQFEAAAHDEIPVLVDRLWPEGAFGFLGAPPKKGKTWVGLALALSIAGGKPLFGHFTIPAPRPVLYVALEGHRAALRARVGALARGMNLDPASDDLRNLHWLYKPRGINLSDPAWAQRLRHAAARHDAAIIIIDVLRASARLKENDQHAFSDLRSNLQPISDDGRAIAMLHHNVKLSEISRERDPGERLSGSGAMFGALDVGIYITGSEDHARKLRLAFDLRDLATPMDVSVELRGEGSGESGGFTYRDTAVWATTDTEVAETRLKAPPLEILKFIRRNGGEATRAEIRDEFGVSDDTVGQREDRLTQLGVTVEKAPGRPIRYVETAPESTPEGVSARSTPGADTPPESEGQLSIQAKNGLPSDLLRNGASGHQESGDMQGKETLRLVRPYYVGEPDPEGTAPYEGQPIPEDAGPPDNDHEPQPTTPTTGDVPL